MNREEMNQIKEERGYSFKQLSEYTGVPVITLQKVFSGATVHPRQVTLDAIERVLTGAEEVYKGKAYLYTSESKEDASMVREPASRCGVKKEAGEYTIEDYYALPKEERVELIDGSFYKMLAPAIVHQDIITEVLMMFYEYIRHKKKPCKVYPSPVDVQLDCDDRTIVEPDLMVVCNRDKIRRMGVFGAPDFVMEILSKSTRKIDMTLKLYKYEKAGVREYWIIDPEKERLIVHNFMDEEYIPCVYQLTGKVPVAITDGELEIDMEPIATSIRELRDLD